MVKAHLYNNYDPPTIYMTTTMHTVINHTQRIEYGLIPLVLICTDFYGEDTHQKIVIQTQQLPEKLQL